MSAMRATSHHRRSLVAALGLVMAGIPQTLTRAQDLIGGRPGRLPPGQSVYRISGRVTVNGMSATRQTAIGIGDTIDTGPDGEIVFVLGEQAMILRPGSRIVTQGGGGDTLLVSLLRIVSGQVLWVSRGARTQIHTPTATIGIRGTGWYAEVEPGRTYFCTCYGTVDVAANHDPRSRETVVATHHDRPLYILGESSPGRGIRPAPFINHTDQELALIEALVGRESPIVFPRSDYSVPRRGY